MICRNVKHGIQTSINIKIIALQITKLKISLMKIKTIRIQINMGIYSLNLINNSNQELHMKKTKLKSDFHIN